MASSNTSPLTGKEMMRANQGGESVWLDPADVGTLLDKAGALAGPIAAAVVPAIPGALSAAGASGYGTVQQDAFFAAGLPILSPLPGGSTVDNAPNINARLQQIAALGGGELLLSRGDFWCNTGVVLPNRCSLRGMGSSSTGTQIIKGPGWTPGATLVSRAGTPPPVAGSGANQKSGMNITDIQLWHGGSSARTGLLLDDSYTSTCKTTGFKMRGNPDTAWMKRVTWDSTYNDCQVRNCGGPLGTADAAVKIYGDDKDKSNLLRYYGFWTESCPHMAVHISDDGNGSIGAPYMISFYGPKMENALISGDNFTTFKSDYNSGSVALYDPYMYASSNNTTQRLGFRFIDLDGTSQTVFNARLAHDVTVSVQSGIRCPRAAGGGLLSEIRLSGNDATKVTSIIEVDAQRTDTPANAVVYLNRSMRIEGIKAYGVAPIIGGAGVEATGYSLPQLYGAPSTFTATAGRNVRRGEMNRTIPYTGTAAANFNITGDGTNPVGFVGDVVRLSQENTGVATFTVSGAGVLQVPTGKSASTNGQYTEVVARKIAADTWRIV